jgi:hypothetical protein
MPHRIVVRARTRASNSGVAGRDQVGRFSGRAWGACVANVGDSDMSEAADFPLKGVVYRIAGVIGR